MIITISGFHGTGKTTIAKEVAEHFKLRYISAGQLFRQMAKVQRMPLEEFNTYVERNPEIDRQIDEHTIEEARKGQVVIEGLLAAWKTQNIPGINILLVADEQIRIKRIIEREKRPYEEVKQETLSREKSEIARFKKLYKIDLNDYTIYDIVLNTALWSEQSMIHIVMTLIKEHLKLI